MPMKANTRAEAQNPETSSEARRETRGPSIPDQVGETIWEALVRDTSWGTRPEGAHNNSTTAGRQAGRQEKGRPDWRQEKDKPSEADTAFQTNAGTLRKH